MRLKNAASDGCQNVHAYRRNSNLIDGLVHAKSVFGDSVMFKWSAKSRQRGEDTLGIIKRVPYPNIQILGEAGLRVSHHGVAADDQILNQTFV